MPNTTVYHWYPLCRSLAHSITVAQWVHVNLFSPPQKKCWYLSPFCLVLSPTNVKLLLKWCYNNTLLWHHSTCLTYFQNCSLHPCDCCEKNLWADWRGIKHTEWWANHREFTWLAAMYACIFIGQFSEVWVEDVPSFLDLPRLWICISLQPPDRLQYF